MPGVRRFDLHPADGAHLVRQVSSGRRDMRASTQRGRSATSYSTLAGGIWIRLIAFLAFVRYEGGFVWSSDLTVGDPAKVFNLHPVMMGQSRLREAEDDTRARARIAHAKA